MDLAPYRTCGDNNPYCDADRGKCEGNCKGLFAPDRNSIPLAFTKTAKNVGWNTNCNLAADCTPITTPAACRKYALQLKKEGALKYTRLRSVNEVLNMKNRPVRAHISAPPGQHGAHMSAAALALVQRPVCVRTVQGHGSVSSGPHRAPARSAPCRGGVVVL